MKTMTALVLAVLLVSCDEPRHPYRSSGPQGRPANLPPPPHEEMGPELVEKGKVLEIAFRLGSTTTTNHETPGYSGKITKSDWDDPFGMHTKTVSMPAVRGSSTVKVEDQFAVVFECQHGKFVIEDLGRDSRAGNLWKKLKQGDSVNIRYKEVYYVVPAEESRKLQRFEFIDANVAKD